MAHLHDDPVIRRDTTVITDSDPGHGSGFGAGMMIAALAILAAVVIGLALLFTQPWDDDGNTSPSVPDVSDSVPGVPDEPNVPDVDPGAGGGAPGDGGDVPAP